MIEISPSKVARIIIRARTLDAKTGRWDTPMDDAEADSILESRPSDATEDELRSYISDLNSDEQASLVAIMWIGRDTFTADDLEEAIETAKSEATAPTEDYLLGVPLLSDYLTSGLEALGYDSEELIDEHLK
ncbi:DUF3775 domain-containing protein [Sinisalibacter lacisalsi]|uniref:DUF3775 domain-containing protein n=1 Tax=Sinisalibacter lacisalsi TaxID=1526570 RepID=A0ABQ1Q914_9RHOB|nr:DUF3775 domain-containing protein [Sinisalibacter lacisalsi]GGD19715.1 hypothetical protein GCM10011358_00370 [Sinisalibacter lacisalsi]